MKVLVAYASKHGSTAEIAETVGDVLQKRGYDVEVMPIADVKRLVDYDAIILGSALYAGKWMKPAADCLVNKREILVQKPVWIFSSGPTGEGNPSELLDGWMFSGDLLEAVKKIQPRDIVFFHGKLDPDKLDPGERLIVQAVDAPMGDFRNWHDIKQWAEEMDLTFVA